MKADLKRDKLRLDWLAKMRFKVEYDLEEWWVYDEADEIVGNRPTLRGAIDAAMQPSQPEAPNV